MPDRPLAGGLQAGTIVAEVVRIDPVDDPRNRAALCLRGGDLVEVRLAEVATVDRILAVVRNVELVDMYDDVLDAELAREQDRLLRVLVRIRRRDGGQRQYSLTEHVARDAQHEAGIDAARE